jgi:hypothetical protein
MHLALYNDVVVFDQATKIIYAISWVHVGDDEASRTEGAVREAYEQGKKRVEKVVDLLTSPPYPELSNGRIDLELNQRPASPGASNMTEVSPTASLIMMSMGGGGGAGRNLNKLTDAYYIHTDAPQLPHQMHSVSSLMPSSRPRNISRPVMSFSWC